MRAVWSFWSKPFRAQHHYLWLRPEDHLLAWVLSVQTARQHFSRTALVTDTAGAHLLVDQLGLEFDEVSTELDQLARHDTKLWALGKVWAYRAQTKPFIHLDSDVFLWKPLPETLTAAPVFAQSPDIFVTGASYYKPEVLERALAAGGKIWLPAEWVWYRHAAVQRGESCGIFGGNRVDFIQHYASQALQLVEHPDNKRGWAMIEDRVEHNILFEQYLLAACIEYHRQHPDSPFQDISIEYLFDSLESAFDDNRAVRAGYTHLIGTAKRNPELLARLAARVKQDYPEYYKRCLDPQTEKPKSKTARKTKVTAKVKTGKRRVKGKVKTAKAKVKALKR